MCICCDERITDGRRLLSALQAAEKMSRSVILSEAKNLSLVSFLKFNSKREILRFAQNDGFLSLFAGCPINQTASKS